MWCSNCERETISSTCDICGSPTQVETATEIHWCMECNVPVITKVSQQHKLYCPICNNPLDKNIYADMRPVFPEERLLIELLLGQSPYSLAEDSVWMLTGRILINGKTVALPSLRNEEKRIPVIRETLQKLQSENVKKTQPRFEHFINIFCKVNRKWLNEFTNEACTFTQKAVEAHPQAVPLVSFSGGKDSTATSDVVMKALSNPSILHLFGDTTLEFPFTYEYVERYKTHHIKTPIKKVRNNEQHFLDVCDDIGPPARLMRWCCSMFKTGPITRKLNSLVGDKRVLTFYGIRKCESVARSKYDRIDGDSESIKIRKQIVASPIFYWKDIDVWLYLLSNHVDFNDAYRLGYDRVGCWCCPNNNERAQFLSQIYMSEQFTQWHDFLVDFARKVGKPDPEEYVDSGNWRARQGGNALPSSNDVKIKYSNCTTEDNARVYQLVKPLTDEFYGLFVPFGIVSKTLGRQALNEVIVLDIQTNMPIISIVPFSGTDIQYEVKIRIMNVEDIEGLFRKVAYQVRKYNACRQCLKCESICKFGAIHISRLDGYRIDPTKCRHCLVCVNQKFLSDGCLMGKYLRTVGDNHGGL